MGQPTSHSTKILNYVKVFQHMMFNYSVNQCVQFVSALDNKLCDQLTEVFLNQTTDIDNSPDGMASKNATEDTGTNFYYNPVTVRQLSLEKIQVGEGWKR